MRLGRVNEVQVKSLQRKVEQMDRDALAMYKRIGELELENAALSASIGNVEAGARAASNNAVRALQDIHELRRMLLDHEDTIQIQHPDSTRLAPKLWVYKGETPQGQTIHQIRDFSERAVNYVVLDPAGGNNDDA